MTDHYDIVARLRDERDSAARMCVMCTVHPFSDRPREAMRWAIASNVLDMLAVDEILRRHRARDSATT